jgi:hypothetical protein
MYPTFENRNTAVTLLGACSRFGNPINVDDGVFGDWYIYRNCSGVDALVRAQSWEDALEAVYDILPTIPEADVLSAYGLSICEYGPNRGYWAQREREEFDVIDDVEGDRHTFSSHGAAESFAYDRMNQGRDLCEGYQYQANSSGTGIVATGYEESLEPLTMQDLCDENIILIWEAND